MVSLYEVERQLKRIEASFRYWGRAEKLELHKILIPGEEIKVCLNGRYSGGFAMLCATDQRLLLIDKKPMYLTLEDVRYDMVAEVDFSHRLVDATIRVCTPTKILVFTTWRRIDMRKLTTYLQQRVLEIRQHRIFPEMQEQQIMQQQLQPMPSPTVSPIATTMPVPTTPVTYAQPVSPLPMPGFSNQYTNTPLLTRRRISRWALGGLRIDQPPS